MNVPMTPNQVNRGLEICAKGTKGPWRIRRSHEGCKEIGVMVDWGGQRGHFIEVCCTSGLEEQEDKANARLIIYASTMLSKALRTIDYYQGLWAIVENCYPADVDSWEAVVRAEMGI